MSILRKKPLLRRFLSNRTSQEEPKVEDTVATPSIVIHDTVSMERRFCISVICSLHVISGKQ